jgi:hypothetical protein
MGQLAMRKVALLNTGMNSRFPNCYKPSMMSFVTSSEKLIHSLIQQRRTRYKFKELRRTSWRRKISAAVIGCGVRANLWDWMPLRSLELARLSLVRLVTHSKLVYCSLD